MRSSANRCNSVYTPLVNAIHVDGTVCARKNRTAGDDIYGSVVSEPPRPTEKRPLV